MDYSRFGIVPLLRLHKYLQTNQFDWVLLPWGQLRQHIEDNIGQLIKHNTTLRRYVYFRPYRQFSGWRPADNTAVYDHHPPTEGHTTYWALMMLMNILELVLIDDNAQASLIETNREKIFAIQEAHMPLVGVYMNFFAKHKRMPTDSEVDDAIEDVDSVDGAPLMAYWMRYPYSHVDWVPRHEDRADRYTETHYVYRKAPAVEIDEWLTKFGWQTPELQIGLHRSFDVARMDLVQRYPTTADRIKAYDNFVYFKMSQLDPDYRMTEDQSVLFAIHWRIDMLYRLMERVIALGYIVDVAGGTTTSLSQPDETTVPRETQCYRRLRLDAIKNPTSERGRNECSHTFIVELCEELMAFQTTNGVPLPPRITDPQTFPADVRQKLIRRLREILGVYPPTELARAAVSTASTHHEGLIEALGRVGVSEWIDALEKSPAGMLGVQLMVYETPTRGLVNALKSLDFLLDAIAIDRTNSVPYMHRWRVMLPAHLQSFLFSLKEMVWTHVDMVMFMFRSTAYCDRDLACTITGKNDNTVSLYDFYYPFPYRFESESTLPDITSTLMDMNFFVGPFTSKNPFVQALYLAVHPNVYERSPERVPKPKVTRDNAIYLMLIERVKMLWLCGMFRQMDMFTSFDRIIRTAMVSSDAPAIQTAQWITAYPNLLAYMLMGYIISQLGVLPPLNTTMQAHFSKTGVLWKESTMRLICDMALLYTSPLRTEPTMRDRMEDLMSRVNVLKLKRKSRKQRERPLKRRSDPMLLNQIQTTAEALDVRTPVIDMKIITQCDHLPIHDIPLHLNIFGAMEQYIREHTNSRKRSVRSLSQEAYFLSVINHFLDQARLRNTKIPNAEEISQPLTSALKYIGEEMIDKLRERIYFLPDDVEFDVYTLREFGMSVDTCAFLASVEDWVRKTMAVRNSSHIFHLEKRDLYMFYIAINFALQRTWVRSKRIPDQEFVARQILTLSSALHKPPSCLTKYDGTAVTRACRLQCLTGYTVNSVGPKSVEYDYFAGDYEVTEVDTLKKRQSNPPTTHRVDTLVGNILKVAHFNTPNGYHPCLSKRNPNGAAGAPHKVARWFDQRAINELIATEKAKKPLVPAGEPVFGFEQPPLPVEMPTKPAITKVVRSERELKKTGILVYLQEQKEPPHIVIPETRPRISNHIPETPEIPHGYYFAAKKVDSMMLAPCCFTVSPVDRRMMYTTFPGSPFWCAHCPNKDNMLRITPHCYRCTQPVIKIKPWLRLFSIDLDQMIVVQLCFSCTEKLRPWRQYVMKVPFELFDAIINNQNAASFYNDNFITADVVARLRSTHRHNVTFRRGGGSVISTGGTFSTLIS